MGDYDHDGRLDLFVPGYGKFDLDHPQSCDFQGTQVACGPLGLVGEHDHLFHNNGNGAFFSDITVQAGLADPTIPFLKWGTGFLDFDNDGLLDLFVANGHVFPVVDKQNWGTTWAERPQLFRNLDGVKFQEVPPAVGSRLADVIPARGAAFGDLFNDGHIDVVIDNLDSTPTLLRNVVKNGNHWVTLKLIGGPKSPQDAIGVKVFVTSGAVRQRADVFSGGSYGSNSDPRVHFGLGSATKVDKVEIQWPSGANQGDSARSGSDLHGGWD